MKKIFMFLEYLLEILGVIKLPISVSDLFFESWSYLNIALFFLTHSLKSIFRILVLYFLLLKFSMN